MFAANPCRTTSWRPVGQILVRCVVLCCVVGGYCLGFWGARKGQSSVMLLLPTSSDKHACSLCDTKNAKTTRLPFTAKRVPNNRQYTFLLTIIFSRHVVYRCEPQSQRRLSSCSQWVRCASFLRTVTKNKQTNERENHLRAALVICCTDTSSRYWITSLFWFIPLGKFIVIGRAENLDLAWAQRGQTLCFSAWQSKRNTDTSIPSLFTSGSSLHSILEHSVLNKTRCWWIS